MVSSSVSADRPDEFGMFSNEPQVTAPVESPVPPRSGRWVLAITAFATYIGVRRVVKIIAIFLLISSGQVDAADNQSLMLYLQSEPGLLMALGASALAAIVTILLGFSWPSLWGGILHGGRYSLADWLAWRPLKGIPGYSIAAITIPVYIVLGIVVTALFGDSSVDTQLIMFEGPLLQVLTPLVVALIVPLAEELIFRGALYSAILPKTANPSTPEAGWQRHIVPFIVTSIAFAAVHVALGFEKPGSIVLIMLMSMYLTGLRSYTGSMKASVICHMTWNSLGAIVLLRHNMG